MRWPRPEEVLPAAGEWAARLVAAERDNIVAVGVFGSYARGDWGVGSDIDLVVICREPPVSLVNGAWDRAALPVDSDLLVYSLRRWHELPELSVRQATMLREETRWLVGAPPA